MLKLSLSYDHRLIDGALAQTALNLMDKLLTDPDLLLMEEISMVVGDFAIDLDTVGHWFRPRRLCCCDSRS